MYAHRNQHTVLHLKVAFVHSLSELYWNSLSELYWNLSQVRKSERYLFDKERGFISPTNLLSLYKCKFAQGAIKLVIHDCQATS